MANVSIRVLGPIDALVDDRPVDVGGPRQRRVLACLALRAGQLVSGIELVEAVWDEASRPPNADRSVRTYVSRLRRALGDAGAPDDVVRTRPSGYELNGAASLDADELARLVEAARTALADGDPAAALERADAALALRRGRPYGELADEPWLQAEVRRLEDLHAASLEERAEALLGLGRHEQVSDELDRWCAEHPLRERLRGQLLVALYRSGRQADALRAYQSYRSTLAERTGLEPGPELRRLEARILAHDPALAAPADEGRSLRAYRLVERIGEGSFAVVWKGLQPSVGREVAVKQIRAELANRPEFIRHFDAEAHLVARLEHPHVVPLYDYWREPGSAYLVMRWLRGGSLEEHLAARGPLAAPECVRLLGQVGAALASAHRAGVIHRDVKPANVLLDEEGNYFLGDFGIALAASAAPAATSALSAGSPAYASPEQLRRQPVGPTTDVWGLGIVLYEALTGQLPFPEEQTQAALLRRQLHDPVPSVRRLRPDLPRGVDDVIQRATAKDPAERYPDVASMVAHVEAVLTGRADAAAGVRSAAATAVGDLRVNPYKGLRPFTEADAPDFFGRDRLVDRLLDRLRRPGPAGRLLLVVGPSGSGKSSVVRAGLVPALRAGRVTGSEGWFLTTMVPGAEPFEELAAALTRVSVAGGATGLDGLAADERGISRATKALLPDETSELVLVIDQLEELFTLCDDEPRRRRFLRAVTVAVNDPRSRIRVVASMRADFWDRPLRYPELAALLEDATVFVGPLAADELERAIVDPAERAGARFEPGLVSEIVADVSDEPGALPLLQYALTELFERHVSGVLAAEAYADVGGLVGALARRADELYEAGTDEERAATRRLFDRLVSPGEGTEDTRRRVLRSELGPDAATEAVLEAYGRARLLSFDRDPVSREPTVEVAHEALIRQWPRLRGWLDEDRNGLRVHRHLTDAARAWEQRGRDASELYRGGRLEAAEDWRAGHPADLNPAESAFLEASRARREAERRRERSQLRRLRSSLAAVAVVAVLALVAGAVALVQRGRSADNARLALAERDRATEATRRSDLNRLIAQSKAEASGQTDLAMLLALEADRLEPSVETESTILNALQAEPHFLNGYGDRDGTGHFTVSGSSVIAITTAGALKRWDIATGKALGTPCTLKRTESALGAVAFGVRTVSIAEAGVISTYDSETCEPVGPPIEKPIADGRSTWILELAQDDNVLYIAGGPGQPAPNTGVGIIARFDPRTGQALGPPWQGHTSGIDAIRVSPDGRRLATGARDTTILVWDVATGTPVSGPFAGHRAMVRDIAWTADGSLLGSTSMTPAELIIWDANTGAAMQRISLPHAVPPTLSFAPDGKRVASAGPEGSVIVWDTQTGSQIGKTIQLQGSGINVRFPEDGRSLIVGGAGGRVTRWSIDGTPNLGRLIDGTGPSFGLWRPDGSLVAVVNRSGGVELVDPASGATLGALPETPSPTTFPPDIAFAPDGATVAVAAGSGVHLYDVASRTLRARIDVHNLLVAYRVRFSPDGRLLAVGGRQLVGFYDAATGHASGAPTTIPITAGQPAGIDLRFSPDGKMLYAFPFLQQLALMDVATRRVRSIGAWSPIGIDLSADGTTMAVSFTGGNLGIADVAWGGLLGEPIRVSAQEVFQLRYTADQKRLVTTSLDKVVRIVDLETRSVFTPGFPLFAEMGTPNRAEVSPDGRQVAVPAENGVILWDIEPDRWRQRACEVVGRNLTAAEWARYLPNSGPHRKTCPQWGLA